MTDNAIKNHLLNTFRKYGFRPNHDQLERAITRYQCFGPRLLTVYMPNLDRCYLRPDIWIFLEMAYPDAIFKADYLEILKELQKRPLLNHGFNLTNFMTRSVMINLVPWNISLIITANKFSDQLTI